MLDSGLNLGLLVDVSLGVLLVATFASVVRLSFALRVLRGGKAEMERMFHDFGAEIDRAEELLSTLHADLAQDGDIINQRVAEARVVLQELKTAMAQGIESQAADLAARRLDNRMSAVALDRIGSAGTTEITGETTGTMRSRRIASVSSSVKPTSEVSVGFPTRKASGKLGQGQVATRKLIRPKPLDASRAASDALEAAGRTSGEFDSRRQVKDIGLKAASAPRQHLKEKLRRIGH